MQNITLYIKRAEQFHTKEYIKGILLEQHYGTVSDVQFIEKTDKTGRMYNGVIIKFSHFENNQLTHNLLKTLQSSPTATSIIKHNIRLNHYWIVGLYVETPFTENHFTDSLPTNLSPFLAKNKNNNTTEKEKLEELQQLIHILSLKNTLLQNKNKKYEENAIKHEVDQTHMLLQNAELEEQLKEKDRECAFKIANKEKELEIKMEMLSIGKANAEAICIELQQEIEDQNNIMAYLSS